ncbi:hypothetical protein PHYC_00274 [Phycisphaerales bacterium]|nr:hypothetical protein PHYC_00274 [Phycisphaerales bacterium]
MRVSTTRMHANTSAVCFIDPDGADAGFGRIEVLWMLLLLGSVASLLIGLLTAIRAFKSR